MAGSSVSAAGGTAGGAAPGAGGYSADWVPAGGA